MFLFSTGRKGKRERTLEMLIKDLYEEYAHDTKMVSFFFIINSTVQYRHLKTYTLLLFYIFCLLFCGVSYGYEDWIESSSIFGGVV